MYLEKIAWEIEQIEQIMDELEYEFPASYVDQKEWQELDKRRAMLMSELSLSLDDDRS